MNYDALKRSHFGGQGVRFGDGSVRFGFDYADIADAIRLFHPGGVNLIVVAPAFASGWKSAKQNNGTLSVLIGLLLPAVQSVGRQTNDPKSQQTSLIGLLRSALAPGGELYVVNPTDGQLLPAV